MNSNHLRSFRLVCKPELAPQVEDLLELQGFAFEKEPFWPLARRLTAEPLPLGASLAARFGYIYIQDRSSMLPPLAFNNGQGLPDRATALDMCASPGSKTGMLGQMAGSNGFVLGNEPTKSRLGTLRANLEGLNLVQCATASFSGEAFPPMAPAPSGWDYIQLDPPCSGWGTVEKNPQVKDLWQGNKVKPLIGLQRKLLQRAFGLAAPGGQVVYSTCTTNMDENEEQVRYATEELGFQHLPLAPVPGFSFEAAGARSAGCWRIDVGTQADGGQGFFVAALQKPPNAKPMPETPPLKPKDLQFLAPKALDSPGVDTSLLPPGQLAAVGDTLLFIPAHAVPLLGTGLAWRGFPLGKAGRSAGGVFRASPLLRCLMPDPAQARGRGFPTLTLENPSDILNLLSGQSLFVSAKAPELGLYFKDLPLCRLKVKGSRAVFTTK